MDTTNVASEAYSGDPVILDNDSNSENVQNTDEISFEKASNELAIQLSSTETSNNSDIVYINISQQDDSNSAYFPIIPISEKSHVPHVTDKPLHSSSRMFLLPAPDVPSHLEPAEPPPPENFNPVAPNNVNILKAEMAEFKHNPSDIVYKSGDNITIQHTSDETINKTRIADAPSIISSVDIPTYNEYLSVADIPLPEDPDVSLNPSCIILAEAESSETGFLEADSVITARSSDDSFQDNVEVIKETIERPTVDNESLIPTNIRLENVEIAIDTDRMMSKPIEGGIQIQNYMESEYIKGTIEHLETHIKKTEQNIEQQLKKKTERTNEILEDKNEDEISDESVVCLEDSDADIKDFRADTNIQHPKLDDEDTEENEESLAEKTTVVQEQDNVEDYLGLNSSAENYEVIVIQDTNSDGSVIDTEPIQDIDGEKLDNLAQPVSDSEPTNSAEVSNNVRGDPRQLKNRNVPHFGNYVEVVDSRGGTTAKLPCHVLGRNLENPASDVLSNGRNPQKPRLGVRIPCMNLASQIVTKAELVNEVMVQSARKRILTKPKGGDIVFKKRITHRLAKNLAVTVGKVEHKGQFRKSASKDLSAHTSDAVQTDNSELLAILEGDEEPDWSQLKAANSKDLSSPPTLTPIDKNIEPYLSGISPPPVLEKQASVKIQNRIATGDLEKELARKQLMELPMTRFNSTNPRPNRKRITKFTTISPKAVREKSVVQKSIASKIITPKKVAIVKEDAHSERSKEPPKTYSNKKASDIIDSLVSDWNDDGEILSEKTDAVAETNINKTQPEIIEIPNQVNACVKRVNDTPPIGQLGIVPYKRARIIKKRVIWDPDVPKSQGPSPITSAEIKSTIKKPDLNMLQIASSQLGEMKLQKKTVVQNQKADTPMRIVNKRLLLKSSKIKSKKGVRVASPNVKRKSNSHRLTEIDRLLQDEGAVKLLYTAARDNEEVPEIVTKPNKQSLILRSKEQRDLKSKMRMMKAAVLRQSTLPVTGRISTHRVKRTPTGLYSDSVPRIRKSDVQDAHRTSVQSPPLFDQGYVLSDSRIIRRHSSSSYSSDCQTPRRTSIDPEHKMEDSRVDSESHKIRKKGVPIFIRPTGSEKTYKGKKKLINNIVKTTVNNDTETVLDDNEFNKPATPAKITRLKNVGSRRSTRSNASTESNKSELITDDKLTSCLKEAAVAFSGDGEEPNSEKDVAVTKTVPEAKVILEEMTIVKDFVPDGTFDIPTKETSGKGVAARQKSQKKDSASKKIVNAEKEPEKVRSSRHYTTYKEINLRKHEGLVQIILTASSTKFKNSLNMQSMKEIREALGALARDPFCRAVLVTSSGSEFCQGLDYTSLVQPSAERRRSAAQEMAAAVKEFLRTLALFPKPLVAGVHASAVGLGATMLPLFDLVLASDKASFSAPAVRHGHLPEGATLLAQTHPLAHSAASELLLACRELTASEALQHGLVTRILWPDKFHTELIPTVQSLTMNSAQAMESTKSILRQGLRNVLESALDAEEKQHIVFWTGAECQESFRKFQEKGEW